MSPFWKNWLSVWCLVVALFGLMLAGAAFEATSAPARIFFAILGGPEPAFDAPFRFSTALMGCVTLGWSVTFYAAFQAAFALGDDARPIWRLITSGALLWYALDSAASLATGFALNALSNTLLMVGYVIPLLATGVLANTPNRRSSGPLIDPA